MASYGEVAELAGWPGRARLVGRILKEFEGPAPVPWQRVLRANGCIAFPEGDPRHDLQADLLGQEGVEVRGGRVDRERYGWSGD